MLLTLPRTLLAASLAVCCVCGCATVEDHVAAGRLYEACRAGPELHNPDVAKVLRGRLRPRVRLRFLQRKEMRRLFGRAGDRLHDKAMLVRAEVRLGNPQLRPESHEQIGVKFTIELHQGEKVLVALRPELRELALMTAELDSAFDVDTKRWTDYGALLRNLLSLPFQVALLPVAVATGRPAIKMETVHHDESMIKSKRLGKAPLANAIYETLKNSCPWELPSPPSTRSLLCLISAQVDRSKPVDLAFRLHYDVKQQGRSCTVWDDLVAIPVPLEPRSQSLVQRINGLFKSSGRLLQ